MAIYKTTSSKVILRKIMRDLNPENADWIDDAIEWIGEALEHIGASAQLEKKGCIIDIEDYKAILPANLYYINQVALNKSAGAVAVESKIDALQTEIKGLRNDYAGYSTIITSHLQELSTGTISSNITAATLTSLNTLKKDSNSTLQRIYADAHVIYNSYMDPQAGLTALAYCTTNFPEALDCDECVNKSAKTKECYYVENGMVKTSFKSGKICLSYTALPTDSDCYPLVPDDISYKEAMFWYIYKKMLLGATFDSSTNGIDYGFADQQWKYYCTQARNAAVFPDIDRMESFMNQWVKLIPDLNRADELFENLGTRENLAR